MNISSSSFLDRLVDRWVSITMTFGLLLVLALTLYPYDFFLYETSFSSDRHFLVLEWARDTDLGVLVNVLLFLPLGFGLTGYLIDKRMMQRLSVFGIVLFVSFVLSYSVEILQAFMPSRFPSLNDVFANTFGGFLGFICYRLLEWKDLELSFLLYVTIAFLISIPLQWKSSLNNWSEKFPLLFGNESTADRPWKGDISNIYIFDNAISETEVVNSATEKSLFAFASMENSILSSYRLTSDGGYIDERGRLANIVWRGEPGDFKNDKVLFLDSNRWLGTEIPASYLTQRLIKSSQFTLGLTVATGDVTQYGPARIVSLSADPFLRNFTLGQEGSDLVFRLRTPLTGDNGVDPQLRVTNVFSTTNPLKLVITYDGAVLLVYTNGVRVSPAFELSPGAAALSYFFYLNAYDMRTYKIIYYSLIFVPLGILLAMLLQRLRGRLTLQILIVSGSVLLASIVLEGILVSASGRRVKLENLLLSTTLTIAPVMLSILFKRYHMLCLTRQPKQVNELISVNSKGSKHYKSN